MSELKTIRVAGWKSIRDETIGLSRLNVFIGANGAGKSNLVSFFKLLNELVGERLQDFIGRSGGGNSVLHYGSRKTPMLDAELEFGTDVATSRYFMRLMHAAVDTLVFSEERIEFHKPGFLSPYRKVLVPAGRHESLLRPEAESGNETARVIRSLLRKCRVFHFHDTSETAHVRQSCYIEANRFLYPDAGNLAAMLYLYQNSQPAVYRRIVSTVQKIVPLFAEFVLEPQRLNPKNVLLNWTQQDHDYLFGPHQLSDGTLRATALATLFLQPEDDLPDVIVLDEPELGLHPQAIETVAGLIRAVSHRCQVILATQSTSLLDHFDPEEIIVTDIEQGCTHFRHLDPEELTAWLADYSVGELWQKNVIGGGPVP